MRPKINRSRRVPWLILGIAAIQAVIPLFHCAAGTFIATGNLPAPHENHTATLLPDGRVLVAGGSSNTVFLSSAAVYDPATGSWTAAGSLTTARAYHSALLLASGKVLVAGGQNAGGFLASAELYDPITGTWTPTGSMNVARYFYTASLLTSGKVLVTGGQNNGGYLSSAEIYDPANGTWTLVGSMNSSRVQHTAVLLPNGKVLVCGGYSSGALTNAEVYDPALGTWSVTGSMNLGRYNHTATLLPNGRVLVSGGINASGSATNSAELYDPATGLWSATTPMIGVRELHTATLLPSGKVLVAGGYGVGAYLSSAEVYDPSFASWTATAPLLTARDRYTATLLANGRVLIAGGFGSSSPLPLAELYDLGGGSWGATGALNTARLNHSATLLPNGKVLVAGGSPDGVAAYATCELYNPSTGSWTATGTLVAAREGHLATLLPTGKVLAAGGFNGSAYPSSTELYDPSSGSWTATGSLNTARWRHAAVLMANGQVMLVGGSSTLGTLSNAEVYIPTNGTWTVTASMNVARQHLTATLMTNGQILVAGGLGNSSVFINSAELYNPSNGTWSFTGSMNIARFGHSSTLLPNGKVLVAGGSTVNNIVTNTAELYDPATGTWSYTGSMSSARLYHTATVLGNGEVLVAGGSPAGTGAELYDPGKGTWTTTAAMITLRELHTATLLPGGKLLVAGGYWTSAVAATELYDLGLGYSSSWQPQTATFTSPLAVGASLALTGTGFRGVSEGSSGGSFPNSPADYPVVQLRAVESQQVRFLGSTNWSTNSFVSTPLGSFPLGYALATPFVNGIPGTSSIVSIVAKGTATVALGNLLQTYDGTAKAASATTVPPGLTVDLTYNGSVNAPTNAGSYTVVGTVDDPNYQGSATNALVIQQAGATVTLGNLSQTYDGSAKSVSVMTAPPGLGVSVTYNGSPIAPSDPGSYTVVATITDPNYTGSAVQTLVIVPVLGVNAAQTLRPAEARWFGLNTAAWDSDLDTPDTISALAELGSRILRWPGGSWGDIYHEYAPPNNGWGSYTTNFIHVAASINAQAFMIANYGTGTPQEAADWVRLCNITNSAGFKYWEIGNECYGSWEADSNTNAPYSAHDPWSYAQRFAAYYSQMKAVDPTIRVGIVGVPGEDSYANNFSHPAFNARTGVTHYGWTPVMLSTLNSLGVTPDFIVDHFYPEYFVDNDATLLQASANWAGDAASLRQQLSDYLGSNGTNVELVCTENNADSGSQGRQSTSIVDALYLADSSCQLMKTEFNSFLWWDLRNGPDTGGDFDSSIYGWRTNGDLGIISGLNARYPTFYAMKLLQYFIQPGDTVLDVGSGDPLLSAYASRRSGGALSLLVVNKDPSNTLSGQIVFTNFAPMPNAVVLSYGIAQDDAVRTNSTVPGAQDIATNSIAGAGANFGYAFPPYSLTLFTFALPPGPPLALSLTTSNTLVISWPSSSAGWRLVQSTDLRTANWTAPGQTVQDNGTIKFIVVTPSGGNRFYRMTSP